MPRLFLRLAFRGTHYHGWQTQAPHLPTVQSTIEDTLARLLGYRTHVHGCGRTDAGVHATDYTAHVDLREAPPPDFDLVTRLNHVLPDDIAISDVAHVLAKAHAQRSAQWRAYRYRVLPHKSPFHQGLAGRYHHHALDVTAMRDVCACIAKANSPAARGPSSARGHAKTDSNGLADFRAFCRRPDQYPHTRCRIDACTLTRAPDGLLDFDIRADRFLHNQVRLLVARMLDVGRGVLSLADIRQALDTGVALSRKRPAAAEGLYLVGVGYSEEIFVPAP